MIRTAYQRFAPSLMMLFLGALFVSCAAPLLAVMATDDAKIAVRIPCGSRGERIASIALSIIAAGNVDP